LDKEGVKAYFTAYTQVAKASYHVAHIQHEFSFFGGRFGPAFSNEVTAMMLDQLHGHPTLVSLHATPAYFHNPAYGFVTPPTPPQGVKLPPLRKKPLLRLSLLSKAARLRHKHNSPEWRHYQQACDAKQAPYRVWCQQVSPHFTPTGKAVALVHNQFTRQDMIAAGAHPDHVVVLPIGVEALPTPDEATRQRVTEAVRLTLNLQQGDQLIGMAGFVSPNKGHATTIEALAALPPSVKLLIAGGLHPTGDKPFYLNQLLALAHQLGVHHRVLITGSYTYDELAVYLSMMDAVVVGHEPPYSGSSASVSVALAAGKAVVANNIATFAEMNALQPDTLLLTQPNAPHELAMRLRQLLAVPALRHGYQQRALHYAATYSWGNIALSHRHLYERLCHA
jgi:glycosyltransferase involved in cell wall biosynthesis